MYYSITPIARMWIIQSRNRGDSRIRYNNFHPKKNREFLDYSQT